MGMQFMAITSFAKTQGEHTFTVSEPGGSERVMKLSGASRTYSHTAEPRNVKFASSIKDWPISTSKTTIFDDSIICSSSEFNEVIIDISPYDTEKFSDWTVVVDGETLTYVDRNYFENKEQTIRIFPDAQPNAFVIWYSREGTYQVKIDYITKAIAEDFKEAVEAVSGGGGGGSSDPYMPALPNPENGLSPILDNSRGENYVWVDASPVRLSPTNVPEENFYIVLGRHNQPATWITLDGTRATAGYEGEDIKLKLVGDLHVNAIPSNLSLRIDTSPELPVLSDTQADGQYILKATKSGNSITYTWVKES